MTELGPFIADGSRHLPMEGMIGQVLGTMHDQARDLEERRKPFEPLSGGALYEKP